MSQVKGIEGIIAVNDRWIIGKDGFLPWYSKADLAKFRERTWGSVLILGRVSYEGLISRGVSLPGREIWVLSREGLGLTVPKIQDRIVITNKRIFVAGGASCYEALQDYVNYWYISRVRNTESGDTEAPKFLQSIDKSDNWKQVCVEVTEEVSIYHYQRNTIIG